MSWRLCLPGMLVKVSHSHDSARRSLANSAFPGRAWERGMFYHTHVAIDFLIVLDAGEIVGSSTWGCSGKLSNGGGELHCHSSVAPPHGLAGALRPEKQYKKRYIK